MPMGNPNGYGGENPMAGFWANNVGKTRSDMLAQLQQARGQDEQRRRQGLAALLGFLALGQQGQGGQAAPKSAPGGTRPGGARGRGSAPTSSRGGAAPLEGGTLGRGSAPSGGGGMKPGGNQSKLDPFTIAAAGSGMAAGAGGAGVASAAAGGLGAFLNSPLGLASIAGGTELAGGLLGGDGGDEEMAKRQMRQQGQQHLFDKIQGLGDRLSLRNQEMRSFLASLGG